MADVTRGSRARGRCVVLCLARTLGRLPTRTGEAASSRRERGAEIVAVQCIELKQAIERDAGLLLDG